MIRYLVFFYLIIMIIPGACTSTSNIAETDWRIAAELPAAAGQSKALGFAGMISGVHHDKLLVAGGANFPDGLPWEGGQKKYVHDHRKKWSKLIEEADAFIFVTAEYDFNYPAPLRNALEFLYHEWEFHS